MPQSDNSGGPNENNVGTNHILLTQKIVKKKKKKLWKFDVSSIARK